MLSFILAELQIGIPEDENYGSNYYTTKQGGQGMNVMVHLFQ